MGERSGALRQRRGCLGLGWGLGASAIDVGQRFGKNWLQLGLALLPRHRGSELDLGLRQVELAQGEVRFAEVEHTVHLAVGKSELPGKCEPALDERNGLAGCAGLDAHSADREAHGDLEVSYPPGDGLAAHLLEDGETFLDLPRHCQGCTQRHSGARDLDVPGSLVGEA